MLPLERGPPPGFDDEDDNGGPTDGDRVLADVRLARTAGTLTNPKLIFIDQIFFLECKYPSDVDALALHIHEPSFAGLLHAFLNDQVGSSNGSDMDTVRMFMARTLLVYLNLLIKFYINIPRTLLVSRY